MDLNWRPFVIHHSVEGFYSLELRGLSIVFRRIGYWLRKLYSCFYIWTNLLVTLAMEFNSLLEIDNMQLSSRRPAVQNVKELYHASLLTHDLFTWFDDFTTALRLTPTHNSRLIRKKHTPSRCRPRCKQRRTVPYLGRYNTCRIRTCLVMYR